MFLSAEFRESHSAAAAIGALAGQGFDKRAMDVFSTRPVEFHRGVLDRPSLMSRFSVAGGLLLAFLSAAFVFWTQRDYPLISGGMPITSYWSVGVVIFELGMAGATAGTVIAFLVDSGLFGGGRKDPVPPLRDDAIYLRLRCEESQAIRAKEAMTGAGAVDVRPLEA